MASFLAGAAAGAVFAFLLAAWGFGRRARFLGRFFSFAAHEINTPITAVNMTILNLLGGVFGPLPAEQVQWIEMMREQMARLNGMVGELRDLIHLELHRDLVMQREDVDPGELVETATRAVEVGCASAGIPLERSVAPGLPKASCDPDRAPRTLTSMLFHARKFRTGGPLRLQASLSGRFVRLSVEFDAARLSPEEAARSLDLFYPAEMRGQSMSATGLGLGILRAVAREQGGDFELEPKDGKARLSLLLPAAITP